MEELLRHAGAHGEARFCRQSADLEQDADAAEADEEGGKQEASVVRQGENAAGQLQQACADGAHRLRQEGEEPPAQKSRRHPCQGHPGAEIEDGVDALLDCFGEGNGV